MSMIGRTTPNSEPGTKRGLLVIPNWRKSPGYGGFIGTVLRGVMATEEWDGLDAKGLWRNASWSSNKVTGFYVNDLEITCQIDLPAAECTYGNMTRFFCQGFVEYNEVTAMSKTYARLESAHRKLAETEGRISNNDYAHWVLRNAAILGCSEFVFPKDPGDQYMRLSDTMSWTTVNTRSAVYAEIKRMLDWYKGRNS